MNRAVVRATFIFLFVFAHVCFGMYWDIQWSGNSFLRTSLYARRATLVEVMASYELVRTSREDLETRSHM